MSHPRSDRPSLARPTRKRHNESDAWAGSTKKLRSAGRKASELGNREDQGYHLMNPPGLQTGWEKMDVKSSIPLVTEMPPAKKSTGNCESSKVRDHLFDDPLEAHEHVCKRMNVIRDDVIDFASNFSPTTEENALSLLLDKENEQLVRYLGCLAMSGKKEVWRTLLSDKYCRRALVCGIVGRALKEKVFGKLCFGAAPQLVEKLEKKELEQVEHDGFFRTRERANMIRNDKKSLADSELHKAVAHVTIQLERLLLPFWKQAKDASLKKWQESDMRAKLAKIVESAARLSQLMRKDAHTIYYWPPTFKDEEFEPARMECYNLVEMISTSPYKRKEVNGLEQAFIEPGEEGRSEAIVQIVCFPGLQAYQQGGGDLAKRELEAENKRPDYAPADVQQHRKILASQPGNSAKDGSEGFRTKVVCKSMVWLRWGKQRLLTKEAGTSTHIDAMKNDGGKKYKKNYEGEGFVELFDLFVLEMKKLAKGGDKSTSAWLASLFSGGSRSSILENEVGNLTLDEDASSL